MTMAAASGSGLLLALSFALLWQRRRDGMLIVLALQSTIVALLAAVDAAWPLAALELIWGAAGLPWLLSRAPASPPWQDTGAVPAMLAAAVLSAVCLPLGAAGPGLAVVLLGALLMVIRPRPVGLLVGLGSLQTGIVAAGLASGQNMALLAAPCLPALALLLQRLRYAGRTRRRGIWPPSRFAAEAAFADFSVCLLLFLFSCALPWLDGAIPGPWRFDPAGILSAMLIGLVAAALRGVPRRASAASPGGLLTVGGFIAVLADEPVLAWIGLAIAATATLVNAPSGRLRLAAIGLGLTLFGSLSLQAAPLPAGVTLLVGLGCLAPAGPELATVSAMLLLRLPPALRHAPGLEPLLIAAGLLALLLAVVGLAQSGRAESGLAGSELAGSELEGSGPAERRLAGPGPAASRPSSRQPVLAMLGQAGVAVFALGLDLPQARLAAVLQLVLLVLTRLALELAPDDGLSRMAALAGFAGLPPFGVFPSLALLLGATTTQAPALLPPLLAGLAAFGWLVLRTVPAGPYRLRPAFAWLPLVLALLIGFALPGALSEALRLVAEQLP